MLVRVYPGPRGIESAIKALRSKVAKDGSMAGLKRRNSNPKRSERRKAKAARAGVKRRRKLARVIEFQNTGIRQRPR